MSEPERRPATDLEEGRYLFCVVRLADGRAEFAAKGIDGEEAYLVAANGVGAVVQRCAEVYDSEETTQVKRWLLAHQGVVDEAGEAFGTPLPFRFDTIVEGDDDAVADWLTENRVDLGERLDDLAGRWEYRIEVRWDRDRVLADIEAEDDDLRETAADREAAGDGAAFLLEKRYEQRLSDLARERGNRIAADLRSRVDPLVDDWRDLDADAASTLAERDDGLETVTRLAVLTDEDRAADVGGELDVVAATPGVEVRYTGPWPPYTFAGALDEE